MLVKSRSFYSNLLQRKRVQVEYDVLFFFVIEDSHNSHPTYARMELL